MRNYLTIELEEGVEVGFSIALDVGMMYEAAKDGAGLGYEWAMNGL